MIITSQPQLVASSTLISTAISAATLGLGAAARSAVREPKVADLYEALMDMRLDEHDRALLERAFQARDVGAVIEDAKARDRTGKLERQYTLVRLPAREIVLLQVPKLILQDGNQVGQLDLVLYSLRGKTVRVFSPDLVGEPSSWFDELKSSWERDEKTYIEFISQSRMSELERGDGELAKVLKIDLQAAAPATVPPKPVAAPAAPAQKQAAALQTIRIFLASSEELRGDRDEFDLYFRQQNDQLLERGLYLKIHRWENFLNAMSETRLQDEYNKAVRDSDIFVSLFSTKAGKFTEEEFDTAFRAFKESGRPRVYTFFKNLAVEPRKIRREDMQSLWAFQDKLRELGHYQTDYDSIEHLKRQFRDQLDELLKGPATPQRT